MRIWFHEWEKIVCVHGNVTQDHGGDDDEILRIGGNFRDGGCLHGGDGDLHDGVKDVRGSVNDDRFSHSGDENEESDEEGNDMKESDGDDEVRNVRIYNGSHGGGDQRVNGDDENGDQNGDENQDHRFQDKYF